MLSDLALSGVPGLVDNIHIFGTALQYRLGAHIHRHIFQILPIISIFHIKSHVMQQLRKEFQVDRDPGASSDQPWPVDQAVEHGGAVLCGSRWEPRISREPASSWVLRMWSYILRGWMKYICCCFSSTDWLPLKSVKSAVWCFAIVSDTCERSWHLLASVQDLVLIQFVNCVLLFEILKPWWVRI